MKSWKTTLFGILAAILGAIASGAIETTPQIQKIAGGLAGIAGGVGLMAAKDGDVTGGTRQQ